MKTVREINEATEQRLDRKFGRSMWHTYMVITDRQLAERCYCCWEPATSRVEVNIWGVVHQYDVCREHTEYDGRNCDGIPAREFDPIHLGC